MAYTHIEPGQEIEVSEHIYYCEDRERIFELVKLPLVELLKLESDSVAQERAIFAKFAEIRNEWLKQARETVSLREAQQNLKTPPVKHTSNQWVDGEYDYHEISNMVYKMTWRVYERTQYDRTAQKQVAVAWDLNWSVYFNTPDRPDYTGSGRDIAGQSNKVFKDKAALEKYLQGRIAAYAHLFTVLSPPIPKGQEGRFSVNGVLLPGYTVETPEPTPQEAADTLLDFLEDEDIDLPQPPSQQEAPASPPPQAASKKTPAHKPKKHAPAR